MAAELRPGTLVRLQNLEKKPALNGSLGTLTRIIESSGRWEVKLDNGNIYNVQSHHVAVVEAVVEADASVEEPVATIAAYSIDGVARAEHVAPPPAAAETPCQQLRGWGHQQLERLTRSQSPALARVWSRWARHADKLADKFIREAFDAGISDCLEEAATRAPNGEMGAVLAHCGSDCADHAASISHVQKLIREKFPTACVAQLGPEDCKVASVATRRLCNQLMRKTAATDVQDASEIVQGADEDDELGQQQDEATHSALRGSGMMDFVDWYQDQRGKAGLVVLLIEAVEEVPQEALLSVLRQFGRACSGNSIPATMVLGLQQAPHSRFELFSRDPLAHVWFHKPVRVFDSHEVCNRLLEEIALDPLSLPVAPSMMQWVRREFLYTRRSVTGTLKTLAVMCQEHFDQSELARFGCLALVADEALRAAPRSELACFFKQQFSSASDSIVQRLQVIWADCVGLVDDKSSLPEMVKLQAAEAAANVAVWHRKCCALLPVWDVLLCTAEPSSRAESRLRRFAHLLGLLWPRASSDSSGADLASKQQSEVDELFRRTLKKAFDFPNESEERGKLHKLMLDLMAASGALDDELRNDLTKLTEQAGHQISTCEVRDWAQRVCSSCWQPLAGLEGSFFIELAAGDGIRETIVRRLSGSKGSTVEALLNPMTIGRRLPDRNSEDITFLWRLLQGTVGRRAPVKNLWRAFAEHAEVDAKLQSRSTPSLRRRFGAAVAALRILGLHLPCSVNGTKAQPKDGGWRLAKRYFGRTWCGTKANVAPWVPKGEDAATAASLAAATAAQEDNHTGEISERRDPEAAPLAPPRRLPAREVPAWTLRLRNKLWANQSQNRRGRNQPRTAPKLAPKQKRARIFIGS